MMEALRDRHDSDDVRQRILACARDDFAAKGLGAASVRTIAKRAGVTAAMINYYFGSKRGLYDEVVAEAQGRLFARLSAVLSSGGREGLVKRLAVAYFDFLVDERQLQRLLLREVLDHGELMRTRAHDLVGPLRQLFEDHFGDRKLADHDAVSLFGAIAGYFLYEPLLAAFMAGGDPLSPERLAERRRHVGELASLFERRRS